MEFLESVPAFKRIMIRLIFMILLPGLCLSSYSQVVRGTVTDIKTNAKIDFATIYISGTSAGTNTDQNGNFELDVRKYKSLPVTITALGYNSVTLTSYSIDKPNNVQLTQKIFELEEVTVNDKSLRNERKANMKLFKSEFLGLTPNAAECEILNENDISFNYNTDDDTLKVYAAKPLVIENRALGYRIIYYLDSFELIKRSKACYFSGNIIFDEDLSENSANKRNYENRRREAYMGSRMHFFRSLFINKLDINGFAIKNQFNKDLNNMELITKKDSVYKKLNYKKLIGICFNSTSPISYLELTEGSVSFDRNGFFDPLSVQWRGEMARHRIADWLPYEYEPPDY